MVMAAVSLVAQQPAPVPPQGVLLEPLGQAGEAIFPAFEGWGPTKDGGQVLLIGYFNRNKAQELDIPIGPDNRIEPGGPDYGQPTRFHTGRQYGVFAITIPKDFGTKRLTWTLRANGQTSTVSFWANPAYWIDFYKNTANGNEPPRIKFAEAGPEIFGPPVQRVVQTLSGVVGQPVPLVAWAADQPPTIHAEEGGPPNTTAPDCASGCRGAAARHHRRPGVRRWPVGAGAAGRRRGLAQRRASRRLPRHLEEVSRARGREDRRRRAAARQRGRCVALRRGQDHRDLQRARASTGCAPSSTTARATAAAATSAAGRRRTSS